MSRLQEPAAARLDDLLLRTSRTFALSIPRLPEPTRREVTVAYLLFRIADTLEDATLWTPRRGEAELVRLADHLRADQSSELAATAAGWVDDPPLDQPDYLDLLGQTPLVFEALHRLSPAADEIISTHTVRTTERMASFLRRPSGATLADLDQLREYCYAVAGIVGEMLTELFLLERPMLSRCAPALRERAAPFGEALQLVNILKDSADDAVEGRRFLPETATRDEVFALARQDLRSAAEYVLVLQDAAAPRGLIEFTALPVLLARRALDRVERRGPGAKLRRDEVAANVARLALDLRLRRPVVDPSAGG